MIVGFQVLLIGLLADVICGQPQAARGSALPRALAGAAAARAGRASAPALTRADGPRRSVGALSG